MPEASPSGIGCPIGQLVTIWLLALQQHRASVSSTNLSIEGSRIPWKGERCSLPRAEGEVGFSQHFKVKHKRRRLSVRRNTDIVPPLINSAVKVAALL